MSRDVMTMKMSLSSLLSGSPAVVLFVAEYVSQNVGMRTSSDMKRHCRCCIDNKTNVLTSSAM
jgi:hypothetical protein